MKHPEAVALLCAHLLRWLSGRKFNCVGFYRPIRGEPDVTEALLQWSGADPMRSLCVPKVDSVEKKTMHYSLWCAGNTRRGPYGIEEPATDIAVEPEVILSPCVGVTAKGYRLGNGGGFFDRWLKEEALAGRGLVTVAVAFECLKTDRFLPNSLDVPMQWILTESGMQKVQ